MGKAAEAREARPAYGAKKEHVPPGYKRTEVGVIPEEWEVVALSALVAIRTGPFGSALHRADYVSSGVPLINPLNIVDDVAVPDDQITVSESAAHRLADHRLEVGDILIARRGDIGRSTVITPSEKGWICGTGCMVLRPRPFVDAQFLRRIFASPRVVGKIVASAVGSTMVNLNHSAVGSVPVQLPPLPEQRAIARALSDVDDLISALDKLIEKKRAIKQATMQQLLTGRTRLPGFGGEWRTCAIGHIATPVTERNTSGDDLPVLSCSKHVGFLESREYFKNQVYSDDLSGYRMIRYGEIGYPSNHVEEGSVGLQDRYPAALVSPIYVVFKTMSSVDSRFLFKLLKLDAFRQKFAVATNASVDRRGSLKWPAFSEIEIDLPPLPEQRAIATVLSDMDEEIAALERRREKTRLLKQGMMQELLTGRIRLVETADREVAAG